jgi:hypothetical protein
MDGWKTIVPPLVVLAAVVAFGIQLKSIHQLRSEVAELKNRPAGAETFDSDGQPGLFGEFRSDSTHGDMDDVQRLAELEDAVAELTRISNHLKERGQVPLGEADLESLRYGFMNAARPDRDRIRALQVLRRNRALTDDVVAHAGAWLQSTTDTGTQRALLQQLDGLNNPSLKQPLLGLTTSQDANVRQGAVENLRVFMADPQVEDLIWQVLRMDTDEDVRQEAEAALARGPFPEARVATLQQRALDGQSSLDERLLALRALRRADANAPAVAASFAELAQSTTDSAEKLKLFQAFDGMSDPVIKLPLVNGLQDPNPRVREEAVDALSEFRSDPAVLEWLQYVTQNDPDPRVRREATSALNED